MLIPFVKLGDWVIDAAKEWPDCTFVSICLRDSL